jgi:uncharacterized protein YjiS (DUF1127 family)
MRTDIHEARTSHSGPGLLAQIGETLHVWRERQLQRRELARWTERDLHDVGVCRCDIINEIEKPFWRE